MKAIVAIVVARKTKAAIAFDEGYPPLAPTDGNRQLLAMYDQASRDVGAGPVTAVDPDRAGAADVSFVAGHVPMILDGVGLMGDGGHTAQRDRRPDDAAVADQAGRAAAVPAIALTPASRAPGPAEDGDVIDNEPAAISVNGRADGVQQVRASFAGKQPMIGMRAEEVDVPRRCRRRRASRILDTAPS